MSPDEDTSLTKDFPGSQQWLAPAQVRETPSQANPWLSPPFKPTQPAEAQELAEFLTRLPFSNGGSVHCIWPLI